MLFRSTGRRDFASLDALAAAYASAARYDDAVTTAQAAVDQAVATGQSGIAAQFRERLALYQRRQAYRVPR